MQSNAKKTTKNPVIWLLRYLQEAKEELGKVSWPSQKVVVQYSVIVIIISLLVAAFFGGLDWILNQGLSALINQL